MPHLFLQGCKGGGKGSVGGGSKFGTGGSASNKNEEYAMVVAKISSTQLPTSLINVFTISTSTTTTKPITKGVVIGSAVGGSSSSRPPPNTKQIQNKGK